MAKFLDAHSSSAVESHVPASPPKQEADELCSRELCAYFKGRLVYAEVLFGNFWNVEDDDFTLRDEVWSPPETWVRNAARDGSARALRRLTVRIDCTCCLLAAQVAWPTEVLTRLYDYLRRLCDFLVRRCDARNSGPDATVIGPPPRRNFDCDLALLARVVAGIPTTNKTCTLVVRTLVSSSLNKASIASFLRDIACDDACAFVLDALWRTLVGTYETARRPVGARVAVTLARVRHMNLDDFRACVSKLLQNDERPAPVLIAAMHERFLRTLDEDGAATPIMRRRHGEAWDHLRTTVYASCDALREMVTECFYDDEAFSGEEAIRRLHSVQCPATQVFSKMFRRSPKTQVIKANGPSASEILTKRLIALDRSANHHVPEFKVDPEETLDAARELFRAASPDARLLMRRVLAKDSDWKQAFQSVRRREDVNAVMGFARHLVSIFGLRFVPLSSRWARAQREALQKRFEEDDLDSDSLERAASFVGCFKCRSVKNFFSDVVRGSRKSHDVSKSRGFRGVALTDAGELVCQSHRPQHQSGTCGQVGLTSVWLLRGEEARAVVFFDRCYLIAPCCGQLCVLESIMPTVDKEGESSFKCEQCRSPPKSKKRKERRPELVCLYCEEEAGQGAQSVVIVEKDGSKCQDHLCRIHARKWLSTQEVWTRKQLTDKLSSEGLLRTERGAMKRYLFV